MSSPTTPKSDESFKLLTPSPSISLSRKTTIKSIVPSLLISISVWFSPRGVPPLNHSSQFNIPSPSISLSYSFNILSPSISGLKLSIPSPSISESKFKIPSPSISRSLLNLIQSI